MPPFNWTFFRKLLEMEVHCFSSFSNITETEWGFFLLNTDWKNRHDANHAMVIEPRGNLEELALSIIQFYQKQDLIPRVNFYHPETDHRFKKVLRKIGFTNPIQTKPVHFMTLFRDQTIRSGEKHLDYYVINSASVEPGSQLGKNLESILVADWDYARVVNHAHYNYFLLCYQEKPVSLLSLFTDQKSQLGRVDDVLTDKNYRNRGHATYLVDYAVSWAHQKRFDVYLGVFEEIAYHIYKKVGFRDYLECDATHWVYQH